MAAALLTLTTLSIFGIAASFVLAFRDASAAHVSIGVFATMLNLLAHSFMMFYLIGKGKAVREAVAENALEGDYAGRIAVLRAPVFSQATLAMVVLMIVGIVGASVAAGALSSVVHAVLAFVALAAQMRVLVTEIKALTGTARIVNEVNARIPGNA